MNWTDSNGVEHITVREKQDPCTECHGAGDGCARCEAEIERMTRKTQEMPHITDDAVYIFMSTGRWPQVAS